jgi:hypothetical protein
VPCLCFGFDQHCGLVFEDSCADESYEDLRIVVTKTQSSGTSCLRHTPGVPEWSAVSNRSVNSACPNALGMSSPSSPSPYSPPTLLLGRLDLALLLDRPKTDDEEESDRWIATVLVDGSVFHHPPPPPPRVTWCKV